MSRTLRSTSVFFSRIFFGLFATAAVAPAAAAAAPYGFPIIESFADADIGPNPAAYSIAQAPDAVLMVGGDGLRTFDGERWRVFTALGLQSIYSMDFAHDGRVWTAAEDEVGWFAQEPDATWKFHSLKPKLGASLQGQVWRIFSEGNGAVFITRDTIFRWDGREVHSWALPGARRLTAFRVGGQIFIGHSPTGLYRLDASGPTLVIPESQLGNRLVLWIDERPGSWLIATSGDLIEYRDGKATSIAPRTAQLLKESVLTSSVRLADGRYAFGTLKGGIIVTQEDGTVLEQWGEGSGIPGNIFSLFVDREGNLWDASLAGVQRINVDQHTRLFDTRAGLPSGSYRGLATVGSQIAVVNSEGISWLLPDQTHFNASVNIGKAVHQVTATENGILIAGFERVWKQTAEGMQVVASAPLDFSVAVPSRAHHGDVLIAAYNLTVQEGAPGKAMRPVVEQLPMVASSLAEDNHGRLWMGTDTQGVFVAALDGSNANAAARPAQSFGLPAISGQAVVRATNAGDVWVFADSGGWILRSGQSRFESVRDFPTRPLAAVAQPLPDGSVWIANSASGSSAATVALVSCEPIPQWQPDSIVGLEAVGAPRALLAEPGEAEQTVLWIGGDKAVMRHVVEGGPNAVPPAAPLLHVFTRSGSGVREPAVSTLPFSTNSVDFEFGLPQFASRNQLRLETFIEGADASWVPAGQEFSRQLSAPRDGQYTFKVRAVAGSGLNSEPAVFSFTVAPPWWRTRNAMLLEALTVVLMVLAGVQWRVRVLRCRNEELEQKVKTRTAELAAANAAKTQFVANMSHDIRNPLSGIVGLAIALEDTPMSEKQRELVSTLRECTAYLSTLVDDVLDFTTIEAGRIEIHSAPYVPAELLNSVVTTLKGQCAMAGAFITIESDPEVPALLMGDGGRTQQILVNYVSNALKYAGGHIQVSASVSAAHPGQIEYAVSDHGPGIAKADQAVLFTKFSRLADVRNVKGNGVGLASCRLLAGAMKGVVGVESDVGHGARFFLRLPLVAATESVVVPDAKFEATTVLLVEDADYNAVAAKAVLAKLGLECDRACNGAEAIKLFEAKRHHIVLLDRNLPDMDGIAVSKRLRELETDGAHAMIFAVTAYCTTEDRQLCLDSGMNAFVGKPLTPEKLRSALLDASKQVLGAGNMPPAATIPAPASEVGKVELDTTLLEYLSGAEGGLSAQIERFLEETAAAHEKLLATPIDKASEFADAAHRVLGQARMVGATRLVELSVQLETAARGSDRGTVERTLPLIAPAIASVAAGLRSHSAAHRR